MERTRNLSKPELVTLAVYQLGGASAPVETEDIAIKAHEFAPGTFAWRKYRDRINLELVRVALVDASRPKTGAYVTGSGKAGWSLTKSGADWSRTAGEEILAQRAASAGRIQTHTTEPWHQVSERSRMRRLTAWATWNAGQTVSDLEAMRVFRIDQYTSASMRRAKVGRLTDLFRGDAEMEEFLRVMARTALEA